MSDGRGSERVKEAPKRLGKEQAGKSWTSGQVRVFWFALICVMFFLILMGASWTSDPIRSDRFISVGLIAFSAGFAAIAFAFLGRQTATIKFKLAGVAITLGGAVAAFILLFGSL